MLVDDERSRAGEGTSSARHVLPLGKVEDGRRPDAKNEVACERAIASIGLARHPEANEIIEIGRLHIVGALSAPVGSTCC